MRQPLSPLCFVLPAQYQQFLDVSDALGYSADWVLKPLAFGGRLSGNAPQLLNIFAKEGRDRLEEFATKKAIVQQFVANPLHAFGQPVNLRFYLIITSIAPLRAYVHSKGLVYHRHDDQKNFKKVIRGEH